MSTLPTPEWLTATEAARYLKIEPRTLLLWARQLQVKGYILSGTRRITWRFLRSDLDATLHIASRALNNGRIE
jgi:helix-turn-helix protein